MQISTANLIAAQQAAQRALASKQATPAPQAFTAALQKAEPFAPMDFAARAPVAAQTASPSAAQAAPQPGPSRPGMHLDIRV